MFAAFPGMFEKDKQKTYAHLLFTIKQSKLCNFFIFEKHWRFDKFY